MKLNGGITTIPADRADHLGLNSSKSRNEHAMEKNQ